jgi:hypothetical protein
VVVSSTSGETKALSQVAMTEMITLSYGVVISADLCP